MELERMLAATIALGALLAPSTPAQDGAAPVARSYDLGALAQAVPPPEADEASRAALLPTIAFRYNATWAVPTLVDVAGAAEVVIEALRDELEYEDRSLELGASGSLLVLGPPSLHARVERVLAFLDQAQNASVELQVDLLRSAEGSAGWSGGSVVPEGEVAALLAGAAARESYRVAVRTDRELALDRTREVSLLADYDVEIAQGNSIADPVFALAPIGTQLLLRAAPASSGLHLALALVRTSQVGEIEERRLRMAGSVTLESGPSVLEAPSVFQRVVLANRSLALSTFLPSGSALVIATDMARDEEPVRELVVIRRVGGELPLARTLALDGAPALVALDLGFVEPPFVRVDGVLPGPARPSRSLWYRPYYGALPLLRASLVAPGGELALDLLRRRLDLRFESRLGGLHLVRVEPDAQGREPRAPADLLAPLAQAPALADLSIALRRGERVLARARLPLRSGGEGAVVLAHEGLAVLDYDVEVAQHSAIPDPVVNHVFDGLALRLAASRGPAGAWTVEIAGGAHLRAPGEETIALRNALMDRLDQVDYERLIVNERLALPADGPARVTLGDAAEGGLSLELELAR